MKIGGMRLALLALASSIALVQPVMAAGGRCTIYQDRNFGGSHWALHDRDDMLMINEPDVGVSDAIHRFLYEPSWNDQVSSFKVTNGCTLTLWEDVGKGGHHFRSNQSYSYVGSGWNDIASEAECDCGRAGLPNY